jgi:hypothetical protein
LLKVFRLIALQQMTAAIWGAAVESVKCDYMLPQDLLLLGLKLGLCQDLSITQLPELL